jgi:hypothetical protein
MLQRLLKGAICSARWSRPVFDLSALEARGLASASSQMASIKFLRERTSAPISDVKAALMEAKWDQGKSSIG